MSKRDATSLQRSLSARQEKSKKRDKWLFWGVTLPLTIIAAISVGTVIISDLAKDESVTVHPGAAPLLGQSPTPAPWTYDAARNQHWDPSHNHWHAGPPPASATTGAAPLQQAPAPTEQVEPWYFDEANNQHWDPGHNHWHVGPPPPPEERGEPAPQAPLP